MSIAENRCVRRADAEYYMGEKVRMRIRRASCLAKSGFGDVDPTGIVISIMRLSDIGSCKDVIADICYCKKKLG